MSQQQAQEVHPSQIVDITQDENNGYFLKVFLLDDSINHAKWRIKTDSIPKHIQKFVGRPFILTKDHYHPLEFDSLNIDYNDIPATVNRLLETQDKYKVGTIRKVERSINPAQAAYGATWNAYVEITDPTAIQAFKSGYTPRYVSASVFRLNQHESAQETTDFEPLHLAAVDNPAYGIHKAGVRGACQGNLTKCSKQLAQASVVYSSLTNSSTSERTDNLSTDNAEQSQQQQPNNVTQSTPGIPTTTADNNTAAASPQQQLQPSQSQSQPPQQLRSVTGNTAPFEVQKQEQPQQQKSAEEKSQSKDTVQDMASLTTKIEALLNRVNELETYKKKAQKTEEETKTAIKRSKIENVIPADYADSPDERTKAIESLMKMPDGPELDYFLQKFVTPVTAKDSKPVQEAGDNNNNKTSFMRAKRVTDYAQTKTPTTSKQKPVQQAATTATNSPDNLDLSRLRRICSMTDIVSNTSNSGGAF